VKLSEIIEVKAKVGKKLFYNEDSMYGVYSFFLIDADAEIDINKEWGSFVVNGNCPRMIEGKEYEFTMIPTTSKKYGKGYSFVEVKERQLNSIEEQQEYLRQVLSQRDANILIEA